MRILRLLAPFVIVICFVGNASAGARVALVIGNAGYQEITPLKNTINDAKAVDKALRSIGFDTRVVLNATERKLKKELRAFSADASGADVALIFYAGHGAQVNGLNYLLPIDMELPQRESDIPLQSLEVDSMLEAVDSRVKVVILDACRDNPALSRSVAKSRGSVSRGLAPPQSINASPTGGIFIAYATESGNVALDGEGENSPFTRSLVQHLTKQVSIDDMFSMVTRDVRAITNNAQIPFKYASLDGIVCLTESCGSSPVPSSVTDVSTSGSPEAPSGRDSEYYSFERMLTMTNALDVVRTASLLTGDKKNFALDRIWSLTEASYPPFTPFEGGADRPDYFRFLMSSRKSIGNNRFIIAINIHEKKRTFIFTSKEKLTNWVAVDCAKSEAGVYMNQTLDSNDMPLSTKTFGNPVNMSLSSIPPNSVLDHLASFVCDPLGFARIFDEVENTPAFWELVNEVSPGLRTYIGRDFRDLNDYRLGYFAARSDKPIEDQNFGFSYSMWLQRYRFQCDQRLMLTDHEYIDEAGLLVAKANAYGSNKLRPIPQGSALELLFNRACAVK